MDRTPMPAAPKIKLQIAPRKLHARWLPSLYELSPYDEAFAKGYNDGLEKARADCQREMEDRLKASRAHWDGIARSLSSVPREIIQRLREQLISLAFSAVRKLLLATPISREEVAAQVNEMLERVEAGSEIEIQLHPEDLALLSAEDRGALWNESLTHLKWTANPAIPRGGAVVHSDVGWIDARRETRLAKLEQLALNATRGSAS
ncbi:MAG: hypothetical protein HY360_01735 [Verrucomicrobia bacterium]|nr:hypothetical protein [Verrucomicrobiota bacterium]